MKNEIDTFLGDLNATEQDPFANTEQELPEFGIEQEPTEVTAEPEANEEQPFHKNPKVKRFIEKQISKALANSKPSETETFRKEIEDTRGDADLSSVLERLIGNDTPEKVAVAREFQKTLMGIKDQARDEALTSFQKQALAERQAEKEAEATLDDAFDAIEESYGVDLTSNTPLAKKTRSEFIGFVQKIAPKDAGGNVTEYPDLSASFEVFQGMKGQVAAGNARAKDIASRGMTRSTETRATQPKGRITWDSVTSDLDRL